MWSFNQRRQSLPEEFADLRDKYFSSLSDDARREREDVIARVYDSLLKGYQPNWGRFKWPQPRLRDLLSELCLRERIPEMTEGNPPLSKRFIELLLEASKQYETAASYPYANDDLKAQKVAERYVRLYYVQEPNSLEMEKLVLKIQLRWERRRLAVLAKEMVGQLWQSMKSEVEQRTLLQERLGGLFAAAGLGWGLLNGFVESSDLQQICELAEQLKEKDVADIIRLLGRDTKSGQLIQKLGAKVARRQKIPVQTVSEVPEVVKSIKRSADVQRMLPFDAALMNHSQGRLLWYSRFTEQALNTYALEGRSEETKDVSQNLPDKKKSGPIIIGIDTSGSMGDQVLVAKAIALMGASIALKDNREYFLYEFSDSQSLREFKLTRSGGLSDLLRFLRDANRGGTNPYAFLEKAINQLHTNTWSRADILMVTDGGFGSPSPSQEQKIRWAKEEKGCRFFGVLVGYAMTQAVHQICGEENCINLGFFKG